MSHSLADAASVAAHAQSRPCPDAWRVNDALRCKPSSVSRATLYKMANSGEIRLARIGGRTLVPDAEIQRLVGEGA